MKSLNNNQQAFFELLRAGLWNEEARLSKFGAINLKESCRIAEEQSVVGLVAAGLEHVTDVKLPKEEVLLVVGQTLQLELTVKGFFKGIGQFFRYLSSRPQAAASAMQSSRRMKSAWMRQ